MYEMTVSFTLDPTNPGKPIFTLPHKLQDQHRQMFAEGKFIGDESGRLLAEWAAGAEPMPLIDRARSAATAGTVAMRAFYGALSKAQRDELTPHIEALRTMAAAADAPPEHAETEHAES